MTCRDIEKRHRVVKIQDGDERRAGHDQAQQTDGEVFRFGELPAAVEDAPEGDAQTVQPVDAVAGRGRIPEIDK